MTRSPPPWFLICVGVVLLAARALLPYKAGLIFKGSISTVDSVCHSSAGAFAIALRPGLQSSCDEAGAWMTGLTIAAVAGLALAGFGIWLAWRQHHAAG